VGSIDELVVRDTRVLASTGEGHEVKSRAARTVIEGSVIASLTGRDSRQIDLPNGGDIVIRDNVLEKGPNSSNREIIGVGMERSRGHGIDHELNQAIVESNTVILDRRSGDVFVATRAVPEPTTRNNLVIDDRDEAGLAPFPYLPSEPVTSSR